MSDADLNDELVSKATRRPLLDAVFPPEQCSDRERPTTKPRPNSVPDSEWKGYQE